MIIAGIDPGINGAIGVLEGGAFRAIHDMPTMTSTTGRRLIDFHGLTAILAQHAPDFVLVERVGPRPGEGPTGAFSFGYSFGGILAVLAALGIPHDLVQPAVWKRRAGLPPGADKRCSVATAKRLLPAASHHLTRVKDDGRAEALLLALQAKLTDYPNQGA
ncbi:MAG: hypothetical protein FIB06_01595 [Betaproteobacteria bacterium]|nr:hypothetical protein [Betaproteobacteria bacterium]